MMDGERFSKPDLPWLHDLEPDLAWPPEGAVKVSENGRWEVVVEPRSHLNPCPARCPRSDSFDPWDTLHSDEGVGFCCLPLGHESPHLSAVDRNIAATSLRRVAQPAEANQ